LSFILTTGANKLSKQRQPHPWSYHERNDAQNQCRRKPVTMYATETPARNEAIVRRLFDEFHNGGDDRVVDEVLATPQLRRQLKRSAARLRQFSPTSRFAIDDLISTNDKVVTRWTAQVRLYNQPTEANGLFIYRIHNGKVVDLWQNWDELDPIVH
jgi:predicted ester cyclase